MAHKRIDLEDLESHEYAHQIIGATTDEPLTAKHVHTKYGGEHIVGRFDDDTLTEMWGDSLRDQELNLSTDEPDISLCPQQVAGKEVIVYTLGARKSDETAAIMESRRLEFQNMSVAKNGIQAVVTTTEIPISANGVHCKENGVQIAGRFSNKSARTMWKAAHAATRAKRARRADTEGDAAKRPKFELNFQK